MKTKIKKTVEKDTLWALTFTKKLVTIIVIFFIVATLYTGMAMWRSCDFTNLGTIYTDICELVKSVAFAYMMKSGFENVPKIIIGMYGKKKEEEVTRETSDDLEFIDLDAEG